MLSQLFSDWHELLHITLAVAAAGIFGLGIIFCAFWVLEPAVKAKLIKKGWGPPQGNPDLSALIASGEALKKRLEHYCDDCDSEAELNEIKNIAGRWAAIESTPAQAGTDEGILTDIKASVAQAILARKGPEDL